MRRPKRIRDAVSSRLAAAKADYMTNGAERTTFRASDGKTLGYRMSPNPKMGHSFHIRFSGLGGSSSDMKGKEKAKAYRVNDADLYSDKVKGQHTSKEAQIRVGTTPPRKLMLPDPETGELRLCKIPAKPKYTNVGASGTKPKDGGKNWIPKD